MNNNPCINNITFEQSTIDNYSPKQKYFHPNTHSEDEKYSFTRRGYQFNNKDEDILRKDHMNRTHDIFADNSIERLSGPFSPQPGDINESIDNNNTQEPSPASFDLDRIISRYGDKPELLQLILSSKLEEDRRRAEEARLKQKELDYIASNKEHTCSNDTCEATNQYKNSGDKGKEKEDSSLAALKNNCSLSHKSTKAQELGRDFIIKRKTRDNEDEQQLLCSLSALPDDKDEDYFSSPLPSSHLSSSIFDGSDIRTKRHGSLHQLYSPSLSTANTGGHTSPALTEMPKRRLQSLDYLTSRQNSFDPFSQPLYRRSSATGKFNINDSIQPNTLPPISSSLLSYDQSKNDLPTNPPFTQSRQSPTITSVPLNNNRNNSRFQSLPTLDSFEASIMETLPFDDRPNDHSSTAKDNSSSTIVARNNTTYKKRKSPSRQFDSKDGLNKNKEPESSKASDSFNYLNKNNTADMKKLPLPPNPLSSTQSTSNSPNRPRRRRREMQAITMIIETRDFPYNDEYVWKNNGNTIHKSSGQKSIYYKCSNSNAGCPVNKTVTFRDNGEYLIKYRGSHLDECSKIKRVNLPL